MRTANDQGWDRRRFLRAAAASAAGAALAGTPVLAACGGGGSKGAGLFGSDSGTDSDSSSRTSSSSNSDSSTGTGTTIVAFRLSTRNQRAPCGACKAHAAHRYYASSEAADADRAHPGCDCAVIERKVSAEDQDKWFGQTDKTVFDDRW